MSSLHSGERFVPEEQEVTLLGGSNGRVVVDLDANETVSVRRRNAKLTCIALGVACLILCAAVYVYVVGGTTERGGDQVSPNLSVASVSATPQVPLVSPMQMSAIHVTPMPTTLPTAVPTVGLSHEFIGSHTVAVPTAAPTTHCGAPPVCVETNGQMMTVDDVISSRPKGLLVFAMPDMKCSMAIYDAVQFREMKSEYVPFDGGCPHDPEDEDVLCPYRHGVSKVWDYLHCIYSNDRHGAQIMHSYVFYDGAFIGQGYAAAEKINTGRLGGWTQEQIDEECDESYPKASKLIAKYMAAHNDRVLVFGWEGCPCTSDAQSRFGEAHVCYNGFTWENQEAPIMQYLQCREQSLNDHSFIYARMSNDQWWFVGNGFQLAPDAMDKGQLDALIRGSGVATTCTP